MQRLLFNCQDIIMKVIALRGKRDCGKTQTLIKVYEMMKTQGFQSLSDLPEDYKDLGNHDFRDVLERNGTRIGIVSQGDYARNHSNGAISVKNLLKDLEEDRGCDIAVCACQTGKGKGPIQEAIDSYQGQYIDKQKSASKQNQDKENEQFAKQIFSELLKLIG